MHRRGPGHQLALARRPPPVRSSHPAFEVRLCRRPPPPSRESSVPESSVHLLNHHTQLPAGLPTSPPSRPGPPPAPAWGHVSSSSLTQAATRSRSQPVVCSAVSSVSCCVGSTATSGWFVGRRRLRRLRVGAATSPQVQTDEQHHQHRQDGYQQRTARHDTRPLSLLQIWEDLPSPSGPEERGELLDPPQRCPVQRSAPQNLPGSGSTTLNYQC